MHTELVSVGPDAPDEAAIARAAAVLRRGGLVAFATETVYGLGGLALDREAVARIFAAKGRPATNPIIVHVADIAAARELVVAWPAAAQQLAQRFWPGPLTLVLPRRDVVPDAVTAGGSTVAVRVPGHEVALALVRAVRAPIAAPSANRSQRLSPTTAQHVLKQLAGRIEMVLDAGPTPGGLESTVLDLSQERPMLLRPGLVALSDIEALLGDEVLLGPRLRDGEVARSPGQHQRHYAPSVPLTLYQGQSRDFVERECQTEPLVGWLALGSAVSINRPNVRTIKMPDDPVEYASVLYATLHDLEEGGATSIVVDAPPDLPQWQAIRDRLQRAAAGESAAP